MTEQRSIGRTTLVAGLAVAVTAGMLAIAGTTPARIGTPDAPVDRVLLDQRTFVCAGNLPGTTVVQGTADGGPASTTKADGEPVVVEVGQPDAAGAYAAQSASTPRWSAWLPCPETHARWWFVGVGGAEVTHSTTLSVSNPRTGAAVIDLDVYGPDGPVVAPGLKGIVVPAGGDHEIDLAEVAPAVGELAVRVVARKGLVAISAADAFSPGDVGKEVREWVPPQSLPAKQVTLAGLPATAAGATLVVVNPGRTEAIAKVEVIGATGTFVPEKVEPLLVPPGSVATVPVTSIFDGTPLAVRVSSESRITATIRSIQGAEIGYATGVRALRGSTAFALPVGSAAQRQIVLSSLGQAGTVTVTAYDRAGAVLETKQVTVAAETSVGVVPPPRATSVQLASEAPTTVAGLVATRPGGLDAAGVMSALRSIRLPAVRPGW